MAEDHPVRISGLVLAVLVGLGLGACGGSGPTTSTAGPRPATSSSVTTVTSTATATATRPAATTDTTASPGSALPGAPCRTAGLTLSLLGQQGAAGHGELGFALRNAASTSCRTIGYPGIQFLDRAGGDLPTAPTHSTRDFFGSSPLRELMIAPGQSASFRLAVTHGIGSSAGCTTAYAVAVIAPNDTAARRVSIPDGAAECGTATVSPLRRASSAYP